MTKIDQRRYQQVVDMTVQTLMDFRHPELVGTILPTEWLDIPTEPVPDKVRITLRVDKDVAVFFRKLGRDYQASMNRVLRIFMLSSLTEMLGETPGLPDLDTVTDEVKKLSLKQEVDLSEILNRMRRRRIGLK